MNLLLAALVGLFAVEALLALSTIRHARELVRASGRSLWVLRARRVSDEWKEKVLLVYARRIFCSAVFVLLFVVVVAAFVALIALALTALDRPPEEFVEALLSWYGILLMVIVSVAYFKVRRGRAAV